jgi:uncharacterized protein
MITLDPYPYSFDPDACQACSGRCCNGESGNIWVTKKEMTGIAEYLGLDVTEFIDQYLRKSGYRFSIKELKQRGNYSCVFFDKKRKGCGIYPVRPEQCRTFPFWPYFKTHICELLEECPGVTVIPDHHIEKE